MPSSKKQKLSKEEKARRKVKSHSSKEPSPAYDNGHWSRASDGRYNALGPRNSARKFNNEWANEYWEDRFKKMGE